MGVVFTGSVMGDAVGSMAHGLQMVLGGNEGEKWAASRPRGGEARRDATGWGAGGGVQARALPARGPPLSVTERWRVSR